VPSCSQQGAVSAAVAVCVEDLFVRPENLSNPAQLFVTPAGQPREPAGGDTVLKLQARAKHSVETQDVAQRFEADRQ